MNAFDNGVYYPYDDDMTPDEKFRSVKDMYVVMMVFIIYVTAMWCAYNNY